ncbi:MAG: serine/threonine-protein kinase [Gemmatimonadaceae bacterium]
MLTPHSDGAPPLVAASTPDPALVEELREALAPRLNLLNQIGEGGMGSVWLARDPALKRLVAVKIMHPDLARDASARIRFAREAESAAAISHPSVVSVYQVGELPRSGTAYFVMQYVEGESLEAHITPGQAIPEPRARRIVGEIASALAAAHVRGLVHRDIKPVNLMLDRETQRVIVLDFGISAAVGQVTGPAATRLTAQGHSIGTPMYMSPEQAAADTITPKSDIYSLGIVAFELVTGRPPFTDQSAMALVAAHIKDTPPRTSSLRPDLSPEFAALIDRCLAKEPGKRPDATDVARALLPSAQALIEWPPPGLEYLRGRAARLGATVAVAVLATVSFLALLLRSPVAMSPWKINAKWMSTDGIPSLGFDSTPIWFFLLTCCAVVVGLTLLWAAARALLLPRLFIRAKRAGYPWSVLLDVAFDLGSDTGALLNGTGSFALMSAATREHLIRLRRVRMGVSTATIIAAATVVPMWAVGWIGGWAPGGEILPPGEAAVLLSPCLIGLIALLWLRRLETRHSSGRWPEAFRWGARDAGFRSELVSSWIASAEITHVRQASRAWLGFLSVASLLVLLPLLGALSVVILAASVSARNNARAMPAAATLLQRLQDVDMNVYLSRDSGFVREFGSPFLFRDADSEFSRSSQGLSDGVTVDTAAGRALAAWHIDGMRVPSYLDVPAIAPAEMNALDMELAIRANPDLELPVLVLWRRLARSEHLPPLGFIRSDGQGWDVWMSQYWNNGLADWMVGRSDRYDRFAAIGGLNLLASSYVFKRNRATSLLRVRENIAVARHMMWSPLLMDYLIGLRTVSDAANAMRELAGRDTALRNESERLQNYARQLREDVEPWLNGGAQFLMADPVNWNPALLPFLGLTTPDHEPSRYSAIAMAKAVRAEAASAAVTGFCLNTREILFGVNGNRIVLLIKANPTNFAERWRLGDITDAASRELKEWVESPTAMNHRYIRALAQLNMQPPAAKLGYVTAPLSWVGLDDLRSRIEFCMGTWRIKGDLFWLAWRPI